VSSTHLSPNLATGTTGEQKEERKTIILSETKHTEPVNGKNIFAAAHGTRP